MKRLRIDVWSDIACPWCLVGKRRLEAALARFPFGGGGDGAGGAREAVEVRWRAFELDPSAPRLRDDGATHAERLARKYGMSVAQAEARTKQLADMARGDGIDFRFDRIRSTNTLDGHRLIHEATERGLGDAMKDRLLRAYFTDGEDLGDHDTLVRLAVEVGLPEPDARRVVESDVFTREVRADEAEARALGIRGVPCFVFTTDEGRFAVSGAQPVEVLLEAIGEAWQSTRDAAAPSPAAGAECGPDGCELPPSPTRA